MPRYRVTIKFKRLNILGRWEKSERQSEFESKSTATAEKEYLDRCKKNDPTMKDWKVSVERVG